MSYRKKLIEVAPPPDEIDAQSSREKSIRVEHGPPVEMFPYSVIHAMRYHVGRDTELPG